ncbi:MAG: molybdopterin molybdotransferase MoeA [Pyrinomonadaceae bacterium]|nr:molybdopterin molybdotransferase MoeA [Pyrinomonadaceae bacterium]
MISISEALKVIKHEIVALESETVDLSESVGRVLAQTIKADMDLPPFDRSQMDGFAVKTSDVKNAPVKLKIIGVSIAGKGFDGELKNGEAVRIMTGARVPNGADAVQKVELTNETKDYIEILEPTKTKQHIIGRGEEIHKGEKIFEKGEIITENMIAALASFGYAKVSVFRKPKVAILATGSEIVDVSDKPQKDRIRNSNSVMLKVLAEKAGANTEVLPLVEDNIENLKKQIALAVGLNNKSRNPNTNSKSKIQNPKSKILIITGGVSVGDYDFTKPALRELGAEIFFEKVSLKPGKPTVFAKLNDVLIFGLPGNPVSVAVTFYLFARAAIMQMQNANNCNLRKGFAVASQKIKGAKERDSFLPISLTTNDKGHLIVESLRFSGSSNFIAFARANALVYVPQGKTFEPGEIAEIVFLS